MPVKILSLQTLQAENVPLKADFDGHFSFPPKLLQHPITARTFCATWGKYIFIYFFSILDCRFGSSSVVYESLKWPPSLKPNEPRINVLLSYTYTDVS